ncbi:cupin domain-containing protein [Agromyces sp. SYSU T00194]|uniref:cupin domain-containing protein n=1 Tax=Agromyces chitinivorans TaxID=3158560 RepID=UPI0033917A6C
MGSWGSLRIGVLAVVVSAVLVGASGCAVETDEAPSPQASPVADDAPVEATPVATGEQDEPVQISVDGGDAGVDVTFSRVRIAPGATTGEHCHHGHLVAVVEEGELTHVAPTHPDGVRVYTAGESIIEGPDYVHEGRNDTAEDVVLWVAYIMPDGEPLAETDLSNCDG